MKVRVQSGFTLIEMIIFIVIVSVGLAGILSVMNITVQSSSDPLLRKQSLALAESLLEEIVAKEYANPTGGYSGTDRSQFDDVNDYAGYTTSGGIVDIHGSPTTGLSQYNYAPAVSVVSTNLNGVAAWKITVSVTGPSGTFSLTGYRANY